MTRKLDDVRADAKRVLRAFGYDADSEVAQIARSAEARETTAAFMDFHALDFRVELDANEEVLARHETADAEGSSSYEDDPQVLVELREDIEADRVELPWEVGFVHHLVEGGEIPAAACDGAAARAHEYVKQFLLEQEVGRRRPFVVSLERAEERAPAWMVRAQVTTANRDRRKRGEDAQRTPSHDVLAERLASAPPRWGSIDPLLQPGDDYRVARDQKLLREARARPPLASGRTPVDCNDPRVRAAIDKYIAQRAAEEGSTFEAIVAPRGQHALTPLRRRIARHLHAAGVPLDVIAQHMNRTKQAISKLLKGEQAGMTRPLGAV